MKINTTMHVLKNKSMLGDPCKIYLRHTIEDDGSEPCVSVIRYLLTDKSMEDTIGMELMKTYKDKHLYRTAFGMRLTTLSHILKLGIETYRAAMPEKVKD